LLIESARACKGRALACSAWRIRADRKGKQNVNVAFAKE
jgi:hypothetical protein